MPETSDPQTTTVPLTAKQAQMVAQLDANVKAAQQQLDLVIASILAGADIDANGPITLAADPPRLVVPVRE